jgi:hypothetical protein
MECEAAAFANDILREFGNSATELDSLEFMSIDATGRLCMATFSSLHLKSIWMNFRRFATHGPLSSHAYDYGVSILTCVPCYPLIIISVIQGVLRALDALFTIRHPKIGYRLLSGERRLGTGAAQWRPTKASLEQKYSTLRQFTFTGRGSRQID